MPNETGLKPGYEQRSFDLAKSSESWVLVAAQGARDGAVRVHQDAELSLAVLPKGKELTYSLKPGRRAWLQVARGKTSLDGSALEAGDGAAISEEHLLKIKALDNAEILLFDLA
jgi:hypothetical protein